MEERGIKRDQWGYEVRTSSDACISAINAYYHQMMIYGRHRSVILKSTENDKDCVLANVLVAHFLSSSEPSRAPQYLQAAKAQLEQATSYEKAVFEVLNCLMSECRDDDIAFDLHLKHLKDFPKDLASLKRGQVLCFYMGRPDLFLNLVEQVLPQNQEESFVYGMYAFALLELGRMSDAEKAAKKALEINEQDVWAQHNMCHVLQHECRFKEAIEFMEAHSSSWDPLSSFMITHNWWHVALCYLEGHSPIQRVIEVYDQHIWKELEKPDAAAPEVYLNCLGLFLRLHLRGELDAFQDRLKAVTSCITDRGNWFLEWHLDVLILWALANANELSKAEDLLTGLKSRFSKMSSKKQKSMQRGLLLAEAMYEYGKGNEKQAMELLGSNFDSIHYKIIGASDEQLDVFNEVWYSVLVNNGQADKAIEALGRSIKKREGVPFLSRLLEKAYGVIGKEEEATIIREKTKILETAYF